MKLEISRASQKDRQAVLNLSQNFLGDYLEYTVDRWIEQEPGGLFMAWESELPVGCCSLYFPSPTEGWLQGMRVHPGHQGRGIAFHLTEHLLQLARSEGAAVIRLLTAPDNHQAIRVVTRLGFQAVGGKRDIIFLQTLNHDLPPCPGQDLSLRLCPKSDLDRAAAYLSAGPAFPFTNGLLFGPGYSYRLLTGDDLAKAVENKGLYFFTGQEHDMGLMVVLRQDSEQHLVVGYLDAPPESLSSIISLYPCWAAEGYQYYSLNLLEDQHRALKPDLERLFGSYGYEHWLLMEKVLTP